MAVFIDLEKAFDMIHKNMLLHKLKVRFGINGRMFEWSTPSYPIERYMSGWGSILMRPHARERICPRCEHIANLVHLYDG